jgi:uncharacterized FlaG/YvyC family protein
MAPPSRVDDVEPAAADPAPAVSVEQPARPATPHRIDIEIARNEATGLIVTEIVTPGSGEVIVQIPLEQILDRVAHLIEQQQRTNEQ